MTINLDQQNDNSNRELYNLMKGITSPNFVKDSSLDEIKNTDNLEKEAFADRFNKAFPINSPVNTYISNAFFFSKKASLTDRWGEEYTNTVQSRIDKAAGLFNIKDELASFCSQHLTKHAQDYSTVYISEANIGGKQTPVYEVKTKADFEKAAECFLENLHCYDFNSTRKIAEDFVKKASTFGVNELPDLICKYAGMFYADRDNLEKQIWYRSRKIASDSLRQSYCDVLNKKAKAMKSKEDVFAMAKIAHEKEWEADIQNNEKVAKLLGDPVDAFFNLSIEKVAEALNVVEVHGDIYHVNDLKKVSANIYKEAFGIDIDPSNEENLKDVLPTMPRSDLSLFRELSGINPL